MRLSTVALISFLAANSAYAQQLAPRNTEPIRINFVNATFEDAVGFVGRFAGIEVKFDESATSERRSTRLLLNLTGVTFEEAVQAMTRVSGLTYKVVDAQTILIYQLP